MFLAVWEISISIYCFCLIWRMKNCIKSYCCCVWLWEIYRSVYCFCLIWRMKHGIASLIVVVSGCERERYRATISAPSNPDHPPSQHRGRQLLSLTTSSTRSNFFWSGEFLTFFPLINLSIIHSLTYLLLLPHPFKVHVLAKKFPKILVYPHEYFCKITQLWENLKGAIGYPFTWKW